jgi:hypothetical protein
VARLTTLLDEWAELNGSDAETDANTDTEADSDTEADADTEADSDAETGADAGTEADAELDRAYAEALAAALLRACEPLSDEMLRGLPATPEDAAASLVERPFADRAEGAYLPVEWLESFCSARHLPLAELDDGWDVSDGEDVYFCPRVELADDPGAPDDTRAFVRVDQIKRWPNS